MNVRRSSALQFPLVSLWSPWLHFFYISLCCSAWKIYFNHLLPSLIPASSVSLSFSQSSSSLLRLLFIFLSHPLLYSNQYRRQPPPSFPRSGAAEPRLKHWAGVGLSWVQLGRSLPLYLPVSPRSWHVCMLGKAWTCVAPLATRDLKCPERWLFIIMFSCRESESQSLNWRSSLSPLLEDGSFCQSW